jgi:hypothetical protein
VGRPNPRRRRPHPDLQREATTRLRPPDLAAYMAVSMRSTNAATLSPGRHWPTPKEIVTGSDATWGVVATKVSDPLGEGHCLSPPPRAPCRRQRLGRVREVGRRWRNASPDVGPRARSSAEAHVQSAGYDHLDRRLQPTLRGLAPVDDGGGHGQRVQPSRSDKVEDLWQIAAGISP